MFDSILENHDDWHLFQQSSIEIDIKKLFDDANTSEKKQLYLYRNSAYTESSAIMRIYRRSCNNQLIAKKKKFNKKISRK